jgi:hypothetical protein
VASLAPYIDVSFDFWSPEQIGLTRNSKTIVAGRGVVHVIASDLMLGAIPTGPLVRIESISRQLAGQDLPLWICFVAANMPTFASLAALSGLCMAAERMVSLTRSRR